MGDGSFGKVYKASLQGQTVAAKLFLPGCDVPIYKRMRQEVRGQSSFSRSKHSRKAAVMTAVI